jgi:type VI secretion system protein ImpL
MSAIYAALFAGVGWVVVDMLGLTGQVANVARMALIGIAIGAVGLVAALKHRKAKRKKQALEKGGAQAAAVEDAGEEIAFQLKDAEGRLVKSRLGKDATLANLPAFLVLGEGAAAKTSNFVSSGVNPELLSGHVYNEGQIAPTRALNLWFGQSAVFVEIAGSVLADEAALLKLGKRLQAKRGLTSLFGRKAPAPRAAVVCLEAEKLLKSGSDDALQNTARMLHGKLSALSQALGVNLPVYVLFTKTDRVGFFGDFVANFSDEEARQVFGATLTLRPPGSEGVYGEAETRRLTDAFNELFYSLCDKRPPFLAREHDQGKQGGVYEFPREFRKLRGSLVRFLVDLCRPSQLQAGPILRGFYFSGVRPVVVEEQVSAPRAAREAGRGAVATGIFELHGNEGRVAPPEVRRRRVPQWVFIGKLFSEILLGDKAAQGTGAASVQARVLRRGLVGLAAGMLLIWSAGMTVSYFNNSDLEEEVLEAARGIGFSEGGGAGEALPSLDALQRLDRLRAAVGVLSEYQREGAPLRYRWGLYAGNSMYPPSRQLYFNRFHQVLFGATQASMLQGLRGLPAKPGPDDEYKPSYDTLKGYLMTTSHHEKTTRDFLSPLLLDRWSGGRDVDPERLALAARQFDFYADELLIENPFEETNDGEAVARARRYLAQFNAMERLYQALLGQAAEQAPSINFNKKFPGSAGYVVNNRDVSGAFTVKGWEFMNEALKKAREFFGGEQWVLGDEGLQGLDPATLEPELRARYRADFLGAWRDYLNNSSVVRYRSVGDAASKLSQLSSNQSHLMALFCLASVNTNVGDPDLKDPFQPLHLVTPPETCEEQYIGDPNRSYMGGLVSLQTSLDRVAQAGAAVDDSLVEATMNDATSALRAAAQTAQNFRIDREGGVNTTTQKLMEDPIRSADGVLGRLGPAQVNGQGKGMCDEFERLISKYPFKSESKIDASLDEVGAVFRPGDGALWRFYDGTLRSYVDQAGNSYVRRSDAKIQITDRFLSFFNRAARFSSALYPGGARDPRLAYSMQALPAEGVRSLTLTLDGQSLKGDRGGGGPQDFVWPGSGVHGARLAGSLGGPEIGFIQHQGLWAAFRFFADADRFQAQGATYRLEWVPRQGQSGQPMTLENGRPLAIPFVLDLKGAPPIFQKGYLEGFACVSQVAQ